MAKDSNFKKRIENISSYRHEWRDLVSKHL